ncbi:hypothetical protein AC579_8976 [Pseudocercospora musae]|uniref:Uncharacterized protein n=1 Tax=Pseudocercospora musae TaxID=113226 RepID=A0A139HNR9_9PEZI|nr:hypothetical protein AC579_8976 [Pseudocercospora musae]
MSGSEWESCQSDQQEEPKEDIFERGHKEHPFSRSGRGLPTPEPSRNNLGRPLQREFGSSGLTSLLGAGGDAVGERLGSEDQSTTSSTRSMTSPTPRPKPLSTERFGPVESPVKQRERRILAKASPPSSQHSPRSGSKASEQSSFHFNFDQFENLNIGSSPRQSAKASPTKRSPSEPRSAPVEPPLPSQLPPLPSSA